MIGKSDGSVKNKTLKIKVYI